MDANKVDALFQLLNDFRRYCLKKYSEENMRESVSIYVKEITDDTPDAEEITAILGD